MPFKIYSVDNDVYNLESDVNIMINTSQNYKVQTTYNPITGWIKVYLDGAFISSWQDPTPLQSGNSISLRSGGCAVSFDNIRVYKSRSTQVPISVGPTDEFSIESSSASQSGFILSRCFRQCG